MKTTLPRYWIALTLFAAAGACTKLDLGGSGPVPTPTSSSTASPTPGVCGTPAVNSHLVVVAMGNNIGAVTVAKSGVSTAIPWSRTAASPTGPQSSTSGSTGASSPRSLQATSAVYECRYGRREHSAVGFIGNAFPRVPYTFPSAAASPVATAVSSSSLWSTGRVSAPTYQQCYSQAFTLTAGTYYFGDLDYYNLSNFRDMLIVATPAPAARPRHATVIRTKTVTSRDIRSESLRCDVGRMWADPRALNEETLRASAFRRKASAIKSRYQGAPDAGLRHRRPTCGFTPR